MRSTLLLLSCLSFLVMSHSFAESPGKVKTEYIITDQIVTGVSAAIQPNCMHKTFQGIGSVSTSTGSAAIDLEVSNDGVNYKSLNTFSLTLGTVVTSSVYASSAPYRYLRSNVTAISGTNAKVSLIIGCQY